MGMQLAIFGGSGRTGQPLVERALAGGHDVAMLVRDPAKAPAAGPHLIVVSGTVRDPARVEQVIRGAQAVISVLGPTRNAPVYDISAGMEVILVAMKQQGVRRLILSLGAGVADPQDTPQVFHYLMNFLVKRMARYVYKDMARVNGQVRASEVDWTIVRVPMLTDGPFTGRVRTGYVGQGVGARISRANLADFMLRQLTDQTFWHKAPAISE